MITIDLRRSVRRLPLALVTSRRSELLGGSASISGWSRRIHRSRTPTGIRNAAATSIHVTGSVFGNKGRWPGPSSRRCKTRVTVASTGPGALMRYGSLTVEIEFTAGVWTDVTSDVRCANPSKSSGAATASSTSQVGTCQLSLFNDAGKYTPASPTSTYYPNVRPNVGLRVTVAGSQRFVGFIDKWSPVLSDVGAGLPARPNHRHRPLPALSRRKLRHTYTETVAGLIPNGSLGHEPPIPRTVLRRRPGNRDAAQIVQPLSNL